VGRHPDDERARGPGHLGWAPGSVLPLEPGTYYLDFYRCIDQGYGDGPSQTPVGDMEFVVNDDGSIN
jgi:hypothetical protein